MNYFARFEQTYSGYFISINKIYIGNMLKAVPTGYFSQKSLAIALVKLLTAFVNVSIFLSFSLTSESSRKVHILFI
ncbi:hypothetical protein H8S37_12385 [Mediterraneibacter sp. NSJ-55]|uniref:Uncharacterized protein n=1 Tax=Mediterraneibacter hominis TaxID=2763054 RepID=A0A923RSW4_9FIRM|nr:hypothetical protein [Mediterraneibacter hominis]MBC5689717.1 hypothetical protein [Mediterraneibacter hominis]